jgi:hypothetical protein
MDPAVIHSLVGLLVPLGGMVSLIVIIVLVMDYRHRRTQQLHETVTRLAEKGLPIPPELLTPPVPKSRLRGALTLVGLGVGLIALFIAQGDGNWGVGAVPLAIGLAQLVAWKLENGQDDKLPGA